MTVTLTSRQASDLFRSPPDRFVDVGSAEVAVRSVGEGPDVLFVHGWPASGATWRALLPHLVPHVRCHLVDLPGAGDSRFDRTSRIGILAHAEAVRQVVDALGLDDVAVVGHDSGGMIARHALAGDPRVRAWGLVDTEQPQGANWRFKAFLAMRYLPRFEQVLGWAVMRPRLRRSSFLLGGVYADKDLLGGEFEEFFLRPLASDPDRQWGAGRFARGFEDDSFSALADLHRRITVPVQLVWGSDDLFFPLAWTREMVDGFGGEARLHVVRGGRLFVHEEFGEEVAGALLPTLSAPRAG